MVLHDWGTIGQRVALLVCALAWAPACGPGASATATSEGETTGADSSESGTSGVASSSTSVESTSTGASTGASATTTAGLTDEPPGTTETTGACEFICTGGPDLPGEECDLFTQDCPEGKKCTSVDTDGDGAWDSALCMDILGDAVHGEECFTEDYSGGLDTCAEGHMCWSVDDEGYGYCVAICTGSPENPTCEQDCTSCMIPGSGAIALCLSGCDPLAPDCHDSELCIGDPGGYGFVCALDASGGVAPAGTPCEYVNVCNAGTMCANLESVPHPACEGALGCCTPFCDYEQPGGDCDELKDELPEIECVPYYEEPVECAGTVGICVVP